MRARFTRAPSRAIHRFDLRPTSLSYYPSFNLKRRGKLVSLLRKRFSQERKVPHPSREWQHAVHLVETTTKQHAEFIAFEESGPLLSDPMLARQSFKQGTIGYDEDSQIGPFIADQTGFLGQWVLLE